MSKIQSDTEHLILNADGSGKEVRFQNNGTQNVVIDSSGNVGIGTASPTHTLEVNGGANNQVVKLVSTDAYAAIGLQDSTSSTDGSGNSYNSIAALGNNLTFWANNAERMRIDSSGNLLHDTTVYSGASSPQNSSSSADAGTVIEAGGVVQIGRYENSPLRLNRMSTDGTIAEFRKDGTTVGTLASSGGNFVIDGAGDRTGLYFGLYGQILPKRNQSVSNNQVDLGASSYKFRDIYLAGGVYVGGTTSANYLDDYEEGTWTPVYKGESSDPTVTYDYQEGKYVKVGRLVTAKFKLGTDAASGGSGNMRVGGLPFTPVGDYSGILGTEFAFATTGTIARLGNGNTVGIRVDDDEGNAVSPSILANGTNDNRLFGTIIYETDS